jgi:repressor LexA
MNEMAPSQEKVFHVIEQYMKEKGYSPSIRDIAEESGLYRTTITAHLKALKDKGYIIWDRGIGRSIRINA